MRTDGLTVAGGGRLGVPKKVVAFCYSTTILYAVSSFVVQSVPDLALRMWLAMLTNGTESGDGVSDKH